MGSEQAYKFTGFVVLILGVLFFLRDIGVNFIGSTSGWTILIVLLGAGMMAGDFNGINKFRKKGMKK